MPLQFLILITSTVLLAYLIYSRFIKPYKSYKFMSRAISSIYKAHVNPYYIIISPILTMLKKDYNKFGDSLHTYKLRDCQLAVQLIGTNLFLVLYDPELIKEFYQKSNEGSYYVKSTKLPTIKSIKYIMGNGLLFSQGAQWKEKRNIMNTVFNNEVIKGMIPLISKISKETINKFQDLPENQLKFQIEMDLNLVFTEIFGNVLIKCFFGEIELHNLEGKSIFAFVTKLLEMNIQRSNSIYSLLAPRFLSLNLRKVDRLVCQMKNSFKRYAKNIISQQIANYKRQNPQNIALKQQKKGKGGVIEKLIKQSRLRDQSLPSQSKEQIKQSYYYTIDDLVDQFKTFFLKGTQTTSSLTCSLVYLLAQHKEYFERVKKQIKDIFGDKIEDITYEKLQELKTLDKCLKETLRIFSPVPEILSRQALKDHYIGQIPVKKGTLLTASILGNHFKSQFYENPQSFNPDRWDTIENQPKNEFSFFPFSSGQRICIGQHLALIQSKIAVVHLLNRYKQIKLEKPAVRHDLKTSYAPQKTMTYFVK